MKFANFDDAKIEQNKKVMEGCLVVVPWVPSLIPFVESRDGKLEVPNSMKADEMDVEENNSNKARIEQGHDMKLVG